MTFQGERQPMSKAHYSGSNFNRNPNRLRTLVCLAFFVAFTPGIVLAQRDDGLSGPFDEFMNKLKDREPVTRPSDRANNRPGTRNSNSANPSDRRLDKVPRPGTDGYPFNTANDRTNRRPDTTEPKPGKRNSPKDGIDWKQHSTSIADLRFPTAAVFRHGDAWLEPEEESAYLGLVNAIANQREQLLESMSRDGASTTKRIAAWEESFYQYSNARRLAWNNGHLRNGAADELLSGMADPFRGVNAPAKPLVGKSDRPYSLAADMSGYLEDFVGRPVVLIGVFTKTSVAHIPNKLTKLPLVSGPITDEPTQLKVSRGTLTAIGSSRKIATVDTRNITFPETSAETSLMDRVPLPVLVKGWVVKNWDGRPLIYCETIRVLSPLPHDDLIRNGTIDKERIQDDEKWVYYETLTQLTQSSASAQKEIARRVLRQRIDGLMREVSKKAASQANTLANRRKLEKISKEQFDRQKISLKRQLAQRRERYRRYLTQPDEFQTYVDVFQNPEVWHGKLVTLKGHVRHVVSYPSDEKLFEGRTLHELWLFTDDSQRNPAVIVTPNLPNDFPRSDDVVDRVSVTGCFFKRYVYGSQDTARIAPLILAGSVNWTPTVRQVQQLVKDGSLAAKSVRAQKSAALAPEKFGETAITIACIFVIFVLMILWGRAQQEERDRIRLRKRVDEVPVFESPLLSDYTAAHTEFISDTDERLDFPTNSGRFIKRV